MTTKKNLLSNKLVLASTTLLVVSLACSSSTSDELADALPSSESAADASDPAGEVIPADTSADQEQTESALPPPTPTPIPEPLLLSSYGFGQDGRDIGYAFLLDNPNSEVAFEGTSYQVVAFDESGAIAETDSGYVELVMPNQTLGIANNLFVDDGVSVSALEIQINAGDPVASGPLKQFEIDSPLYRSSDFFSYVSGVVRNPYDQDISNLRVSAIAYDDAGAIIGSGFTYLNFLLANEVSGVEFSLTSAVEPSRFEIYASVSGLSSLTESAALPDGVLPVALANYGFGQSGRDVGFGFLVENPNAGHAVENTQYQVSAFSSDGAVIGTEEGYIEVILPDQSLGVGGDIFVLSDDIVHSVDVKIKSGEYVVSEPVAPFGSENVSYKVGSFSPEVTGFVLSPYSKDITYVRVSALAYNDSGEIVGGGFTYLDFAPANDRAAVVVSVAVSETPSNVELYAFLSGLSDIQE